MEAMIQTLMIGTFYSIPTTFIFVMFSFSFWGVNHKLIWKRTILFAIIQPSFGVSTLLLLPTDQHMLLYIGSYILFLIFIYKDLTRSLKLIIIVFSFVCIISNELLATYISWQILDFEARFNSMGIVMALLWPIPLIIGLTTIIMVKNKFHPGKRVIDYIKKHQNSSVIFLLLFLFLQLIMVLLIIYQVFADGKFDGEISIFSLSACQLLIFIIFFMTLRTISQTKEKATTHAQEVYLKDIEQMFNTIRGQRHDFLNHVQVIRSMNERNKFEDLKRYTNDLLGEIDQINEIIHIGHPAVSALIQSKIARSMSEKIKFTYQFTGLSQITSSVKSIDIVKIMANLLDNAFDEVSTLPIEQREVDIQGRVEDGILHITVKNPTQGDIKIEPSQFFEPGYSTKDKSEHSGLGLNIVKEHVERYKGKVIVESALNHEFIISVALSI